MHGVMTAERGQSKGTEWTNPTLSDIKRERGQSKGTE